MLMLVPSAWENLDDMEPSIRAFYEYHSLLTEAWDGPSDLAFSDGTIAGAVLDRNGLRPSRYKITEDGLVVAASEVGVFELDDRRVVEKGRLGPGEMIAVDTRNHRVLKNRELKLDLAGRRPYGTWIAERLVSLPTVPSSEPDGPDGPDGQVCAAVGDPAALEQLQRAFGYTSEEVKFVIRPMGVDGLDAVWSMGDDTPTAALSSVSRVLYSYFKQRFAQVTNPPIDSLRERLVMSLRSDLGSRRGFLVEGAEHAERLHLESPLLSPEQLVAIESMEHPRLRSARLSAHWALDDGPTGCARWWSVSAVMRSD